MIKNNHYTGIAIYLIIPLFFIGLIVAIYSFNGYMRQEKQSPASAPAGIDLANATNLHVPWSMVFLPNGNLLVTQRNGLLTVVGSTTENIGVPHVVETGEGGLLGLALHPDFASNNLLYLYFTARSGQRTINRVAQYIFIDNALTEERIIIDNIPGGTNHNGGRIEFGPDGMLYITTGDAGNPSLAQDTDSLAGKILRLNSDGSIPGDNPFGNAVYSYGHRNPQGLAWDDRGNLWGTEHGRSGIQSGLDEINLIEKGANYGWPEIQGDETRAEMKSPIVHSGSTTWAPAGIVFKDGFLYFAGLRGESLYKVEVMPSNTTLGQVQTVIAGDYGRLRGATIGKDNFLYVSTSNTDGRGNVNPGDDKIVKISI